MDAGLDALLRVRAPVLVFLPGETAVRRFLLTGALDALLARYEAHFVVPEGQLESLRALAPELLTPERVTDVRVRPRPEPAVEDRGWLVGAAHDGQAPLPDMIALLDHVQPLFCLVATASPDLFCHDVAWACERGQVTCVLLQSGWADLAGLPVLPPARPYLGCWGPDAARQSKLAQGSHHLPERALGCPYGALLTPALPDEVARLRRDLGVSGDDCLVVFVGASPEADELRTLVRIDEAIRDGRLPGVRVLYRPHPSAATDAHQRSFTKRAFTHVTLDPGVRNLPVPAGVARAEQWPADVGPHLPDLVRLLSAADAVIGPPSTALIESILLDRPTMAMFDGEPPASEDSPRLALFEALVGVGALAWSSKPKRAPRDWLLLLKEGKAGPRARLMAARGVVTTGPGTYAERLDIWCRETVEPAARRLRYKRAGARRSTISHTYGALGIAARYCRLPAATRAVPGYWMHGWIPEYHNVDPVLIALHKRRRPGSMEEHRTQIEQERATVPQFVSRVDQADYLRSQGYRHVDAIGLPVVYVPTRTVRRVPGSLLVLPPHGQKSHGPGDPVAEAYAGVVADFKEHFETVVVGLTEDDFVKQQWTWAFERWGIDVVMTAQQSERDTIERLADIMSAFEFVTTNGFGSHIPYAALFGAKVSVYGPYAGFSRDRMAEVDVLRTYPELVDEAVHLCSEDALRRHYPFLFAEPQHAVTARKWGEQEVGMQVRVEPTELARLFGWSTAVPASALSLGTAAWPRP